eukprot:m.139121 g.139121  ORF g.139121 m.139121 type:complete len:102 (+) comp14008_c0_seq12:995-1300(+)
MSKSSISGKFDCDLLHWFRRHFCTKKRGYVGLTTPGVELRVKGGLVYGVMPKCRSIHSRQHTLRSSVTSHHFSRDAVFLRLSNAMGTIYNYTRRGPAADMP